MIRFLLQVFAMVIAYIVAFSAGYLDGKGIDLPWMVDFGFCFVFAFAILLYGAMERK